MRGDMSKNNPFRKMGAILNPDLNILFLPDTKVYFQLGTIIYQGVYFCRDSGTSVALVVVNKKQQDYTARFTMDCTDPDKKIMRVPFKYLSNIHPSTIKFDKLEREELQHIKQILARYIDREYHEFKINPKIRKLEQLQRKIKRLINNNK